tara:strand:- start:2924 stop:3781 length:858 start_codon:yes stop_codon:yes gene_type:complete
MNRLKLKINKNNFLYIFIGISVAFLIIIVILTSNYFSSEPADYNAFNPQFATPTPTSPQKDDYVPANTPTPEPTPTPEVPGFSGLFMAEISNKIGVKPSNVRLISYEDTIFNDSSLGCPEPGKLYAQVITPGWKIVFNANGNIYEYHSNIDGSYYIDCTSLKDLETENILESFNLNDSESIDIYRLKNGQFFPLIELNGDERKTFLNSLDNPIKIIEKENCNFLYKISFVFNDRSIDLFSICEDGKKYGEFKDSEKKAFELPDIFMNLIGKYSSSLSFPGKPSLN